MEIKIENGKLHIIVPVNEPLTPSTSGKSLNLYTSNGIIQTALQHQGKVVKLGLNVFVSAK